MRFEAPYDAPEPRKHFTHTNTPPQSKKYTHTRAHEGKGFLGNSPYNLHGGNPINRIDHHNHYMADPLSIQIMEKIQGFRAVTLDCKIGACGFCNHSACNHFCHNDKNSSMGVESMRRTPKGNYEHVDLRRY